MTEQQQAQEREQDTEQQPPEEHKVPKARLDQESQKRQDSERRARDAEQRLQQMQDEQERAQQEQEQSQGQWQKTAEREQKKREKAEAERDKAISDLTTYKTRGAFAQAARGIIRADAIDDAYLFLSSDELETLKDADPERYEAAARRLAESRPYLADGQRGSGSGGSGERISQDASVQDKRSESPLRRGQRRKIY